jgi:hypothetical protein
MTIPKGQRKTTYAEKVRWARGEHSLEEFAKVTRISVARLQQMESGVGPEYIQGNQAEHVFNSKVYHTAPAFTMEEVPAQAPIKPALKPMGFAGIFKQL